MQHRRRGPRLLAVAVLLAALGAAAVAIRASDRGGGGHASSSRPLRRPSGPGSPRPAAPQPPVGAAEPRRAPASFAVGVQVLHLLDRSRTIRLPDGSVQHRPLLTIVRYPALPGAAAGAHAAPAGSYGPFPLVVFGHGFAVTPAIYSRLLESWTRAGFIVAAPVFPIGNERAPGGPYEPDLVNQPADMSFVISSILAASRAATGPLAGMVDPAKIAVAGQSDGGDTALASAYDPRYRDRRIRAAVILSGAEIPYTGSFSFPRGGPPLLATQGTADSINPPQLTSTFFAAAHRPKFLLWLTGAEHLPPYTDERPQLGVLERVTIAFLDRYLARRPVALRRLLALGRVGGIATIEADP